MKKEMDQTVQIISSVIPCREKQIEDLFGLIGFVDEPLPECIFICGHSSTGKTSVVKKLLETLEVNHVILNLVECYTNKILFELLLTKLSGHFISKKHGFTPSTKCDNSMDFINNLKNYAQNKFFLPAIIVLDKVEMLRNDPILFSFFLRLQELSGLQVSVIMISNITFEKFSPSSLTYPIVIFFPQYSKDELLQILSMDFPDSKNALLSLYECHFEFELDFYKQFLNMFLSVFFRVCRDVSELKYLVKITFPKYCQPIIANEISKDDVTKIWRNIAPVLKQNLDRVYLRINNLETDILLKDVHIEKFKKALTFEDHSTSNVLQETNYNSHIAQTLELPFYAKYLLIAAYLASYNPAKEDKKLFMKCSGKRNQMKHSKKPKNKIDMLYLKLGPKQFTLDRLLAIFYVIVNEHVGLTSNLLVQISSLVELKLLMSVGNELGLDAHKYKCLVGFEFIQTLSKMVGFNIRKYLYDFI